MEDNNSQNDKVIHIDETTANMLELIGNADDNDINGVVQKLPFEADAVEAFLKATGRENTPEAKLIIDAFRKKNDGPAP